MESISIAMVAARFKTHFSLASVLTIRHNPFNPSSCKIGILHRIRSSSNKTTPSTPIRYVCRSYSSSTVKAHLNLWLILSVILFSFLLLFEVLLLSRHRVSVRPYLSVTSDILLILSSIHTRLGAWHLVHYLACYYTTEQERSHTPLPDGSVEES